MIKEEGALRRSAILGCVGFVAAALWGIYILAGISISGYNLGRDATTDLLVVVPPLAVGGLLLYGAAIAARAFRGDDWLIWVLAGVLLLSQGALGVSLCAFGAWAGVEVSGA